MSEYCKVLIIDDEYIMRQGIKHMLEWEKEGFQIIGEASNGQEGLEMVEQMKPDIILADIVMPILDGIEFSKILHARYPEIQLIILSSYDKFEYVKETLLNGAVDYILKPTLNPDILLKTLRKVIINIPGISMPKGDELSYESQLERVILGYQSQLDEEAFSKCFPYTKYRMLGINVKSACGNQKHKIMQLQEFMAKFYETKESYVHLGMFLQEEILCYVFNYRIKDEDKVIEDATACVGKLSQIFVHAFCVMGNAFFNMHKIKMYYTQELKHMVGRQFYYPKINFLVLEEPQKESVLKRFDYEKYSSLLNYGDFQHALRLLKTYILYACEIQVEEYKIKNLAKNLLYNFLMEIEKYDIASEELKTSYFRKIDQTISVQEFQETLENIISELDKLREEKIDGSNVRINEIKKYIHEHYQEQLDLAELSEKFNFNYNYLSSYFGQHTKEGFSEYLNKIRVSKACELLVKGNMMIADISNEVGYTDHSYFCRVFKKMTGDTPSVYRRRKKEC